jgi:LmbE family N-acetylglucosaminyl deacetylase
MSTSLSLLGLFAHPDDEQLMTGAFARHALEGMRTGLVCATRGECGEIAEPTLATPENLGAVREAELRAACAVIGVKYLYFLDYRDSGMIGTPENEDPRNFLNANEQEALGRIIRIVRDYKPTIMVTFDPTGGYGHPDHLTIHKLASTAFNAAADPAIYPEAGAPWQAERLYYSAFPRSSFRRMQEFIVENDLDTSFRGLDPEIFGLPDEEITNELDVREWVPSKERSFNQHRTQINPNSPFAKLSPEIMQDWRSKEYFKLAAGTPLPSTPDARGDLFAGLRGA